MNLPKLTAEQGLGKAQGVYINYGNRIFSGGNSRPVMVGMMEDQPTSDFSDLPVEMYFHMFQFMDIKSLGRFGRTSELHKALVKKYLTSGKGTCYFSISNNSCSNETNMKPKFNIKMGNCCNREKRVELRENFGLRTYEKSKGGSWRSNLTGICVPCKYLYSL